MIEIIFDRNADDVFLGEKKPVCSINKQEAQNWQEYRKLAKEILESHKGDKIVIIRNAAQNISVNWLAVALFIESCFLQSETEAVVFKTENYSEALAAYKPFVALSIGLKYAIRLYQDNLINMYKEIAALSYLHLSIKEDYLSNKLSIKFTNGGDTKKIKASTVEEALTAIGIIKSLSLASAPVSIECDFDTTKTSGSADIDKVIQEIVQYTKPFIESN